MDEIKTNTCCKSKGGAGVDNNAYEESIIDEQLSADEPQHRVINNGNHHHVVEEKRLHRVSPAREEIGLAGMNYRQLCNCEEDGMKCACRTRSAPPNKQTVRHESWGRCKCITLGVFVSLACVWVVVYLTLDLTGVV